jgi:hypothetical protein
MLASETIPKAQAPSEVLICSDQLYVFVGSRGSYSRAKTELNWDIEERVILWAEMSVYGERRRALQCTVSGWVGCWGLGC